MSDPARSSLRARVLVGAGAGAILVLLVAGLSFVLLAGGDLPAGLLPLLLASGLIGVACTFALAPWLARRAVAPHAAELARLRDRAAAAATRERELSAEVAHELRTPLTGLKSTLEIALSRDREPERYRQTMTDCLAICDEIQRVVEALLSLARLEAGPVEVGRQSVAVAGLVADALHMVEPRAAARSLRLTTEIDPELRLETDRDKLRVIVNNLLDNAVSYADEGGTIRIEAADSTGGAELVVANSGSELTQDQADQAFERFWRGDAARTTGKHVGLGLPLCRKLSQVLGGTISAESTPGGTFRVRLALPRGGEVTAQTRLRSSGGP